MFKSVNICGNLKDAQICVTTYKFVKFVLEIGKTLNFVQIKYEYVLTFERTLGFYIKIHTLY